MKAISLLCAMTLMFGCAGLRGSSAIRYVEHLRLSPGFEWRFTPVLVDLNRDGHLDLVVTRRTGQAQSLFIWLGDGRGGLTPLPPHWTSIGYGQIAVGDLNGDAYPDLVVASHFGQIQTLLSNGRGGFEDRVLIRVGMIFVAAQLADVEGDGRLELLLLGEASRLQIFRAETPGQWTFVREVGDPLPNILSGRTIAAGDLNHDGHVDLVVGIQGPGVFIYYGDGRGNFTGGGVDFRTANVDFDAIVIGDVNKDGHPDIVINGAPGKNGEPEGPDVYLGDGRGGWTPSSTGLKRLKATIGALALGDVDGDGHLDIVAGGLVKGDGEAGYGVFWFRGNGKGQWELVNDSGLPLEGLSRPHGIALADIDRDGRPEIAVVAGAYPFRGSITIWRQQPQR